MLLCKTCNESTGRLHDSEFAKFANLLASKYNIIRERGSVRNEIGTDRQTGREVVIKPGYQVDYLHPEIKSISENQTLISASSIKRYQQAVEQLKKQAVREDREIDFTPFTIDTTPRQIIFTVDFSVNQDLVLRSTCRTLCNFYYLKTTDRKFIKPVIEFITTDMENRFAWFCDLNLVSTKYPGKPYHLVIIKGDKKKKALIGYFEIFGEKGFISLMNGDYTGDDLLISYTYDPINNSEIRADYSFDINVGKLIQHIIEKPQL